MPNCIQCGTPNDVSARFCGKCGTPLSAATPPPPPPNQSYPPPPGQPYPPGYAQPSQSGMQPNVAGLLCYAIGWLTGIIFYFIDKRPFVRFHAMQSILLFAGLTILNVFVRLILVSMLDLWSLLYAITRFFSLLTGVLWLLMMYKAYKGEWFKLPVIGDTALRITRP